jgi:hypothetical protein
MKRRIAFSILLVVVVPSALFFYQNMVMVPTTTITYSQLSSVSGGLCTIRPSTAGASFYNALVGQRTAGTNGGGLRDVEVLHHVSTRLGFGLSPFGSLVPNRANDCTTVFIAEEIARQLGQIGTNVDTSQLRDIRRGLLPFTMYPRGDIGRLLWRFQNDPTTNNYMTQLGGTAHAAVFFKARQEVAILMTLRNIMGSQTITSSGALEDHQFNLEDKIGEFWFNHFNVDYSKAEHLSSGSDNMVEVMRSRAGSTFYSLLLSVIRHPSMIRYLDNSENYYQCDTAGVCRASNQNLARELLELHTFGLPPKTSATDTSSPYDQNDVVAMSEILAGWNTNWINHSTAPSQFNFNTTLFAKKTVTLMGVSYPATDAASAQARVESVLKMLANHSRTKTNICRKLAKNLFASDMFVTQAETSCVANWGVDGSLRPMYRSFLLRSQFWSKNNYKTLYRTPIEIPIASARALGMNLIDLHREVLRNNLTEVPYNPATLTIPSYVILLPALKATSPWWATHSIGNDIRRLLGVMRGEVALPIGYSDNGLDHLSASYVDEVSRITLNISNYLEGMDKTGLRIDKVSNNVRLDLENRLATTGNLSTQQHAIQNILNMGSVVRYTSFNTSTSGYELPASQQSIISQVVLKNTAWPVWADKPGSYRLEKALGMLSQSTAIQLKK